MYIQNRIEFAASQVVSSSLAANGYSNWGIHTGLSSEFIDYPLVEVVCSKSEDVFPYNQDLTEQRAFLTIAVVGIKTQTSASVVSAVADKVITPFYDSNICGLLNGYLTDTFIQGIYKTTLDVTTADDGWVAGKVFEILAARTS
jgi:hypothetical protein